MCERRSLWGQIVLQFCLMICPRISEELSCAFEGITEVRCPALPFAVANRRGRSRSCEKGLVRGQDGGRKRLKRFTDIFEASF